MAKVPGFAKAFAGRWRIVEMDVWDNDFLDLVEGKRSFPRTWTALATADRFQTDASGQAAAALRKLKGRRSSIATFSGR
ncbi:hypothetical protein [Mesorhizobium sp. LNHC232B00]|uniref:hypothetical protein n=1 Tax=Mesorhizobium sp. LNHC232B00 TaxID=1287243 RepID=UPI000A0501B5|nr:hypothetical protein [Mesorhizobium sp. LNHC232B00]